MMREPAQQFNLPPHPFPIFPSLTSEPGAFFSFFFNLSLNPPQNDGLALGRLTSVLGRDPNFGFICLNLNAAPRDGEEERRDVTTGRREEMNKCH